MEISSSRALIFVAFFASLVCLVIAPAAIPEGYSLVDNSLSEAAAQATEGAWLARTGFLLFGLGVFCLGVIKQGWPPSARYIHGLFGLLMLAIAVYSDRPYVEDVPFDRVEDMLHSVAATAMGFVLGAGILIVGWRRIPRWKPTDVVAFVAAVGLPIVATTTGGLDGLVQRALFATAYIWYGLEVIDSRRRISFDTIG